MQCNKQNVKCIYYSTNWHAKCKFNSIQVCSSRKIVLFIYIFVLGTYFTLLAAFWISNGVMMYIDINIPKWALKYKVQSDVNVPVSIGNLFSFFLWLVVYSVERLKNI